MLGLASLSRRCLHSAASAASAAARVARMMKVSDAQLALVLRPSVQQLTALFEKHQYELRVAGGAVRDLLRGLTPHDLDFATTATPQQMKEMFKEEGVRMINGTGEKHGTITARIEEDNFECTTLRIDIRTDGRHAEVQFTKDWYLDANRRDLTINSMFLGMDGTVYDYFDGKAHLEQNRVEFVGDPNDRIQEDYLRVLRYFRFYGRVAKEPEAHSPAVIEAITQNSSGLAKISGERIWSELQKIVVGNYGGQLLKKMVECKLGPFMGLPEDYDGDECAKLFERCQACGIDPHTLQPMSVLAAGFTREDDAYDFIARVKCSKKERELLVFIIKNKDAAASCTSVRFGQHRLAELVVNEKGNETMARHRVEELLRYSCQPELLAELQQWTLPKFPVAGGHLVDLLDNKKKTRYVMVKLFEMWRDSEFTLTREELLAAVDEVQSNVEIPRKSRKLSR